MVRLDRLRLLRERFAAAGEWQNMGGDLLWLACMIPEFNQAGLTFRSSNDHRLVDPVPAIFFGISQEVADWLFGGPVDSSLLRLDAVIEASTLR